MLDSNVVNLIYNRGDLIGHSVGFKDLTQEIHAKWIKKIVFGNDDYTLMAHRASYKSSCMSIAIALMMIYYPQKNIIFLRKADNDVSEMLKMVEKALKSSIFNEICKAMYNEDLVITECSSEKISTNLWQSPMGSSQLLGMGIKSSITGKHAEFVITDDICNIDDRRSKAERDRTKLQYQELQNIRNRGGRIINLGTKWHKEDVFTLMPNIDIYDYKKTGLITPEKIQVLKKSMASSLFAANYELRIVAEDDMMFTDPIINADPALVEQGESHIDAAYGGEDFTAFTIARLYEGKWYVYGRLWHKHVDDVLGECLELHDAFMAGRINVEDNGDKGYLAKAIRDKGYRAIKYHEKMNKHIKISTYLKAEWDDVIFVKGTDQDYINQICDYTEDAEHDDAPDSLASLLRKLSKRKQAPTSTSANYLY